jgi:hypothetical protein
VSDVIEACPGGFHVEHGDVDGVLAMIEKAKGLPAQERARIHSMNRAFVASQFSRKECIASFAEHVGIAAMTTLPSATSPGHQTPSGAQLGGAASNRPPRHSPSPARGPHKVGAPTLSGDCPGRC